MDADVKVTCDTGTMLFTGQVLIRSLGEGAFSQKGDSGSLIVERSTKKGVALLFAGSATHTMGNHLSAVLKALKVFLVSS